MDDNRKLNAKTAVIIIMAALLVLCLVKIGNLESENRNLRSDVGYNASEINMLKQQISSIYQNVDEQMKKEASLLSDYSLTRGEFDPASETVAFTLSVVPKELRDGMELSVTFGGETAPLVQNGAEFVGTLNIGLFADHDKKPLVILSYGDNEKTEYLERAYVAQLFSSYLPTLNASASGSCRYQKGHLYANWNLDITAKPAGEDSAVEFVSYELVEVVNGAETSREAISLDKIENGTYSAVIQDDYEVPEDGVFYLYVDATDSLGYIHRVMAHHWKMSFGGAVAEAVYGSESIYSADGVLLYGMNVTEVK